MRCLGVSNDVIFVNLYCQTVELAVVRSVVCERFQLSTLWELMLNKIVCNLNCLCSQLNKRKYICKIFTYKTCIFSYVFAQFI